MNKELFDGLMQSFDEAIAYSKGELQLKTTICEIKKRPSVKEEKIGTDNENSRQS